MESKAKADAAEADLLLEEEKMSQAKKKKKTKSTKKTSASMSSPVDKLVEQKPSAELEPGGTSQSPKTMEKDSMEPKDTLGSGKGPLEISSTNDIQEEATKVNNGDMQNMPGEDAVSGNLESALGGAATRYNSALDMTLKNEVVIMKSKVKSDVAKADLLLKEGKKSLKGKKSQAKKTKKDKSTNITSTSMASPVDKTVEHDPSVKLETEEYSKEPERGPLETKVEGDEARYNSSLDMRLKNEIVNMELKAKSDAAEADLLLKEEKKPQAKKKKTSKSINKITSTSMVCPVEHKPSVDLKPGGTSQSPETMEEVSMEPEDTLTTEKGPLEITSTNDIQEEATKVNSGDMQTMPGEDSVSGNLESALGGAAARYSSALDMTLKALVNINVLKEQVVKYNKQPCHDNLEEQVLLALQSLFTSVVSEEIKTQGVYSLILRDLLVSLEAVNSMSSGAAEVLVTILEFWHCWKNSEQESLVTLLFSLEENERMSCRKCKRKTNYPDNSSYGIVIAADSIRNVKCAFGDIKFVDTLKVIRMEYKMLCDTKTGGCGATNCVHHVITRCPPIFIIVLEWEKSETEKEISETTNALEWEVDISRLYEGLDQNTNYRLVSMVGYSEEEREHICMAYERNRWVNLRRESLAGEVVGSWKSVVRFCGERKIRPEILFYEAAHDLTSVST